MAKMPMKWNWTTAGLTMCHICQNGYEGGKKDCGNRSCPLYARMPYKPKNVSIDLEWLSFNPKKPGIVGYEDQFDRAVIGPSVSIQVDSAAPEPAGIEPQEVPWDVPQDDPWGAEQTEINPW